MKWNYKNGTPVEGTFIPLKLDRAKVKEVLMSYADDPIVETAFASVGYAPDQFLIHKAYREIPSDLSIDYLFLLLFQIEQKPFLTDYFVDIANGYFHIFSRPKGYKWKNIERPLEDIDIVSRLYFSDNEEDIWDLVQDLPVSVKESLDNCYEGNVPDLIYPSYLKDSQKANRLLRYLSNSN